MMNTRKGRFTLLWIVIGTMALGIMVVSGTIFVVKKRKNNKLS